MQFLASTYCASVTNAKFRRTCACAFARARNVMSTQSATEFEWSVKLVGDSYFHVGIASNRNLASEIEYDCDEIYDYDETAILYSSDSGSPHIRIGPSSIRSHLRSQNNGDIIRFRFQPHSKKLVIDAVSLSKSL